MAWAADLDRGQRELEQKLVELGEKQREAIATYEARLDADAERLDAASEDQRLALTKLREELQRFGTSFLEEGRSDIEIHAAERRRALHEVSERIRSRERALREQLERDEAEARARIAAGLEEAERRHLSALDRAFERATTRLSEYSGEAVRRADQGITREGRRAPIAGAREGDRAVRAPGGEGRCRPDRGHGEIDRRSSPQRRINDVARSARPSTRSRRACPSPRRQARRDPRRRRERQAAFEAEPTWSATRRPGRDRNCTFREGSS